VTYILKLDLDVLRMYLHTSTMPHSRVLRTKVSRSIGIEKSQVSGFCDVDLDPMTVIHELDPYTLKVYLRTKNKIAKSFENYRITDIRLRTSGRTHRQRHSTETITTQFRG